MPQQGKALLLALLFCCAFGFGTGAAAETGWDAVGIRGGADLTDAHGSQKGYFHAYELFANYLLPWSWRRASGLKLRTRLDMSAGELERSGYRAFLATCGPGLALDMLSDQVELDAGVSASYLNKHDFPGRNLGSLFLFNLHAGIDVHLFNDFGLGYHYEHMSNAYLYAHNPGVNLHMLELKYRF